FFSLILGQVYVWPSFAVIVYTGIRYKQNIKKSVWGSGSKPKGETLGDSSQTRVQATLIIGKCQLKFGEKHVDIGSGRKCN
ncbi:MAG: hypothetical protein OXI72_22700, partial [Gemmatimonadota bacterium]|nr:hypothetical protein [Gemmatimonadota bacterium]